MPSALDLTIYLADLTYVQQGLQSEIMPYAVGCIGTYAKRQVGGNVEIRLFKRPEKLIAALREKTPDVMAFSNYAWNYRLACAVARVFKTRHPEVPVIMGGPNYPLRPELQTEFLQAHPEIDFYVIKEGEVGFAQLVVQLVQNDFDLGINYDIPSVHYLRSDGSAVLPEPAERIRDLSLIPSPYLSGIMDEFFGDGFWPIIQTNRGCPFSCTFCVEGTKYYNKVNLNPYDKIRDELDYIGRKMVPVVDAGGRADLFIADSNFGMYKDDIGTCESIRACQDKYGWPKYISVATGKNQKERVLSAARLVQGAMRLSGSVQSLDSTVLENIKRRNVSSEDIMRVAIAGSEIGANTYSEVILGLPGDSRDRHVTTVSRLIEAGFNKVETYTLMLLPGSEMDDREHREKFGFVSRYRVIPKCFGYFDYDGLDICAAEIEEVVAETNTLSYGDYLDCRILALLVGLFHNDGLFDLPLRFIKSLGVPVFDCIEGIPALPLPEGVARLIAEFRQETHDELWIRREDLERFVSQRANIDRYISGELGSNLLFKYKSRGMIDALPELARVFAMAIERRLALDLGGLSPVQGQFISEMTNLSVARARGIFDRPDEPVVIAVRFDVEDVIDGGRFAHLSTADVHDERQITFILDRDQKDTIRRLLRTYGNSIPGLTRALTRFNVKRLLRRPIECIPADAVAGKRSGYDDAATVVGSH